MDSFGQETAGTNLVGLYRSVWDQPSGPGDVFSFLAAHPEASLEEQLELLLVDQRLRWQRKKEPHGVEVYFERCPAVAANDQLKLRLIVGEYRCRRQFDSGFDPTEFARHFPEVDLDRLAAAHQSGFIDAQSTDNIDSGTSEHDECADAPAQQAIASTSIPECIGRYRILKALGAGSFGSVFLGRDETLERDVAIKVPHIGRLHSAADRQQYLDEARILARLDHAGIMPIYDFGETSDGSCFLVSKFVPDGSLKELQQERRLSYEEAAKLVADVAAALAYAHQHGIYHRDIKPANILIDTPERAYLADFGLALREEDIGSGPKFAGTLAYMRPEQVGGLSHLLNERSDVYSLGVVLYELLAGRRPYVSSSRAKLIEQITKRDAPSPRTFDPRISAELERICLKAISRRSADRYHTAFDLANDLRAYLQGERRTDVSVAAPIAPDMAHPSRPVSETPSSVPIREPQTLRVVPKGLRSFDANDADFFLELLPGARDRAGLPESIRFWKTRIEELDADESFRVGLIYGPTGCGKSSLVKAGLIPRLAPHITTIYLETGATAVESHLLKRLQKVCSGLSEHRELADALAAVRRGHGLEKGKKLLRAWTRGTEEWQKWNAVVEATVALSIPEGDGEILVCLLHIKTRIDKTAEKYDPAAEQLLLNLLAARTEQDAFATCAYRKLRPR